MRYIVAALCVLTSCAFSTAFADAAEKNAFETVFIALALHKEPDGTIHMGTTLSNLGAFSGYALQYGIRKELIEKSGKREKDVFVELKTKVGDTYYFGSIFDEPLYSTIKGRISVWSLIAGAAQHVGATKLPDVEQLARENVGRIGSGDYGLSAIQGEHRPKAHPMHVLKSRWPLVKAALELKKSRPLFWSWEIAQATQLLIIKNKNPIPPEIAAQLVMESAISMSKIDPKKLVQQ